MPDIPDDILKAADAITMSAHRENVASIFESRGAMFAVKAAVANAILAERARWAAIAARISELEADLEAAKKASGFTDHSYLLAVIAAIRETSDIGAKPMLSELPKAVGDRIAAAGAAARRTALEAAAEVADAEFREQIGHRDACLSQPKPNCQGALTRARQAQTAETIAAAIRTLAEKGNHDAV